jgi:hypothetical protein
MKFASGALLLLLTVAGCGSATTPIGSQASAASASSRVMQAFDLYTHCGIREAKIGSDFYAASPVLDDGNGNPPTGWGNPGQIGTMAVYGNGTAHFSAPGGLEADFRLRPGATAWAMICS